MSIKLLLLTALICTSRLSAQEMIPFEFTSEEENRLIKENDSVKFYVASDDTTDIVCLNEDALTYRLLSKERKLIANGSYILENEKYLQDGKWTEHFENGKIKLVGYYQKGIPVGTWEEFFDNGKPKTISNYAIIKDDRGAIISCLSGSFHQYYKSGGLKTEGFYAAALRKVTDTEEVEDPVTGVKTHIAQETTGYRPEKTGHWESYAEGGNDKPVSDEKKED